MFLISLFSILLNRYWGQEELTICYPVNIRPKGFQNAAGFYVSVFPLNININAKQSIIELITDVTNKRTQNKNHENLTFPEIIKFALDNKKINLTIEAVHQGRNTNISTFLLKCFDE